jgi:hypothetical protein
LVGVLEGGELSTGNYIPYNGSVILSPALSLVFFKNFGRFFIAASHCHQVALRGRNLCLLGK